MFLPGGAYFEQMLTGLRHSRLTAPPADIILSAANPLQVLTSKRMSCFQLVAPSCCGLPCIRWSWIGAVSSPWAALDIVGGIGYTFIGPVLRFLPFLLGYLS